MELGQERKGEAVVCIGGTAGLGLCEEACRFCQATALPPRQGEAISCIAIAKAAGGAALKTSGSLGAFCSGCDDDLTNCCLSTLSGLLLGVPGLAGSVWAHDGIASEGAEPPLTAGLDIIIRVAMAER